jgi:predicted dehydrogenase
MSKTYRIAIIGCGGIANGKHMPSLSKLKNVEMVAFCDIVVEKAKEAAEKYGKGETKVYENYKEVLKDSSIDIVHVCTPNDAHAEIAIAALEAGKHVMCEKPMAKTAADARLMVAAAKRSGN